MGGKIFFGPSAKKLKTINEKYLITEPILKVLIQHKAIALSYYSSLIITFSSTRLFISLQSSKDDESTNPSPSI